MIIISPLRQALCANRTQISYGIDPNIWIVQGLPPRWSLFSFHFFVDWNQSPIKFVDNIWLTRLVEFENGESPNSVTTNTLELAFSASQDYAVYQSLKAVFSKYGHKVRVILLPEIPVGQINNNTPCWTIYGEDVVKKSDLYNLKNAIQRLSGGPVRVGYKGLTYGTSAIECALSNTDAAFPGDVDAIIVDNLGMVRFVIEYKKHTLDDALENHLISKYYPIPDGRKYRRLDALASHYRKFHDNEIPLIIFYYSTRKPEIRLMKINELREDIVTISKDTGNLNITGMSSHQVGNMVIQWLERA
jgi:hypothetical protein